MSPSLDQRLDRAFRAYYGKLLAALIQKGFDVMAAEEAVSQAFQKALNSWAQTGSPSSEEAWLMTVALRCAIDFGRKQARLSPLDSGPEPVEEPDYSLEPLRDERLRLFFLCTHPAIDEAIQTPLMLQLILGMNAAEISSLLLLPETHVAQRLVRAKKKVKAANITPELPSTEELESRSQTVLQTVYGLYTKGWDLPGSSVRLLAAKEALELAELLAELLHTSPEALGLYSLILFCESRRTSRLSVQGDYIPLSDQNPQEWDWSLIEKAEHLLSRAVEFKQPGRFQLEASIQSAHVHRLTRGQPDWPVIVTLYHHLVNLAATQGSRLGLAAALAHTEGPQTALDSLDEGSFSHTFQPYHSLRSHLLLQLGREEEAKVAAQLASDLSPDPAVKAYFSNQFGTKRE